jgi:hypothetical protein
MVYCMTETNLWPPRPEIWECSTSKGSAVALPLYISAGCPTGVRCTSAVGHMVPAFMTQGLCKVHARLHPTLPRRTVKVVILLE